MTDGIHIGTMLLEDGAERPVSLPLCTTPYLDNWSFVTETFDSQLGRKIEAAGWTFFYMANEINGRGFGFSDRSRTDRAVAQVIATVKRENCNCLEITKLRRGSFFGIPCTLVTAHARHIQKSRSFCDTSRQTDTIPPVPPDWLYGQPQPSRSGVAASVQAL